MYEELYQANKAMLWATAKRYRRYCEKDRAVSVEDLVQSGFIGLMEAARTYTKTPGKSWNLHAQRYILREIYAALGLRDGEPVKPHSAAVSLDEVMIENDVNGLTLMDTLADENLPDADEALLQEELRRDVRNAVNQLIDPRQRKAVELYGLEGLSAREVAEALGVSGGRAMQLYGRALASLARDIRLRALVDLDDRTKFYAHKGVKAFNHDWTSVTEGAALWRIEQRERMGRS